MATILAMDRAQNERTLYMSYEQTSAVFATFSETKECLVVNMILEAYCQGDCRVVTKVT